MHLKSVILFLLPIVGFTALSSSSSSSSSLGEGTTVGVHHHHPHHNEENNNNNNNCTESDFNLRIKRETVCASLVGPTTPWCTYPPNVTAAEDWPNQAVYMHEVISALIDPSTCLTTPYAVDTVNWLNISQADPTVAGGFQNTWSVFQVGYYAMPRPAGSRIEAPDTLGRKCWAMAYLRQFWDEQVFEKALESAGLSANGFIQAYDTAVPLTMTLCSQVLANCFVNATYNPARNGTCPGDSVLFYLGFERENALRNFSVVYPFYG